MGEGGDEEEESFLVGVQGLEGGLSFDTLVEELEVSKSMSTRKSEKAWEKLW